MSLFMLHDECQTIQNCYNILFVYGMVDLYLKKLFNSVGLPSLQANSGSSVVRCHSSFHNRSHNWSN